MALREAILDEAKKHLRYIRTSGEHNIGGPCPFHKSGEERRPSFYINLNNGLFYCHSCGVKGTFAQFLKLLGASAAKIDLILELSREERPKQPAKITNLKGQFFLKESLLGVFDFCPTRLVNDGFDPKLLRKLDVGFDKEAMRITFPIRDMFGNLVGISGRTVTDEFPRYKVYKASDLRRFVSPEDAHYINNYDIKNHTFLWNMHNVFPSIFYGKLDTLIVVEGYKACIWLLQQGIDNTVALQGSRMSRAQEATINKTDCKIFILLDNNKAGKEGTLDTGSRLLRLGHEVFVCSYPDELGTGAQPDNLDQDEILASLDAAQPFVQWRQQWNTHQIADYPSLNESMDT